MKVLVTFCTLTVCIYMPPSKDSTADVIVKMGPFSMDDPKDYSVDVRISDGGRPSQTSITTLAIKVMYFNRLRLFQHDKTFF